MDQDIIRVLRLIEYEGPRSTVEDLVSHALHGTKSMPAYRDRGAYRITGVTLGIYPEVIEAARQVSADDKEFVETAHQTINRF